MNPTLESIYLKAGAPIGNTNAAKDHVNQTDTPAFKSWFGDSKVVDKDGKPLKVYHGTTTDFDNFDPEKTGQSIDGGWYGYGSYFSTSEKGAEGYATYGGQQDSAIMPVYISVENPFVSNYRGEDEEGLKKDFDKRGWNFTGIPKCDTATLIKNGYDGVFVMDKNGELDEITIFKYGQVKSAIGNNGKWSRTDPKITSSSVVWRKQQFKF